MGVREIVLSPQQRLGGFLTAVVGGQCAGVHHTEKGSLARGGSRVSLAMHRRLGDLEGFAPEPEVERLVRHRPQDVPAQGSVAGPCR
ncbi:hypothetical protein DV517_08020 [Streptomyces sp. S816]|uniref:hypothetical protein n=1 Tax=Streptomyces sp. S816 TaxID=2283197 RepID=UPI00113DFCF4|nr:hypothetical protein DV517_08020 [Streptomyces sp. S816]